jgi:hypothetical protein
MSLLKTTEDKVKKLENACKELTKDLDTEKSKWFYERIFS